MTFLCDCSFETLLNEAAGHLLHYIEHDESTVVGTTYKKLRSIVSYWSLVKMTESSTDCHSVCDSSNSGNTFANMIDVSIV